MQDFIPFSTNQPNFEPSKAALGGSAMTQGTADNFPVFTPSTQFASFKPSGDSSLISSSIPFNPSQNAMYTPGAQVSSGNPYNMASQGFMPSAQIQQVDSSMYKSELCKNWTETGFCATPRSASTLTVLTSCE